MTEQTPCLPHIRHVHQCLTHSLSELLNFPVCHSPQFPLLLLLGLLDCKLVLPLHRPQPNMFLYLCLHLQLHGGRKAWSAAEHMPPSVVHLVHTVKLHGPQSLSLSHTHIHTHTQTHTHTHIQYMYIHTYTCPCRAKTHHTCLCFLLSFALAASSSSVCFCSSSSLLFAACCACMEQTCNNRHVLHYSIYTLTYTDRQVLYIRRAGIQSPNTHQKEKEWKRRQTEFLLLCLLLSPLWDQTTFLATTVNVHCCMLHPHPPSQPTQTH